MKALLTAFALLTFVAATTVPVFSAQAQTQTQTHTKKKHKKHVKKASKKSSKKARAHKPAAA